VTSSESPPRHFPPAAFHDAKQRVIDRFELDYVRALVRRANGNLSAASREAGLDRKSITRLLERHGLDVPSILRG